MCVYTTYCIFCTRAHICKLQPRLNISLSHWKSFIFPQKPPHQAFNANKRGEKGCFPTIKHQVIDCPVQKSGNDNVCNYIRLSTWHTHSSWGYSQVLPLLCGQRDGRNISFTIRTVILSSHNFGTWTFQTLLSHRHCFFDMKYLSINGQRASSYGLIRARGRLIHTRALTPN